MTPNLTIHTRTNPNNPGASQEECVPSPGLRAFDSVRPDNGLSTSEPGEPRATCFPPLHCTYLQCIIEPRPCRVIGTKRSTLLDCCGSDRVRRPSRLQPSPAASGRTQPSPGDLDSSAGPGRERFNRGQAREGLNGPSRRQLVTVVGQLRTMPL